MAPEHATAPDEAPGPGKFGRKNRQTERHYDHGWPGQNEQGQTK
jgi:hypothetical protein